MSDRPPRLLDQVRRALRTRHYSPRTESAYLHWIVRYIRFHGVRHPNEMGAPEVSAFLTHLAVEGNVAPSTQNQALNALVFLYGPVLERPLGELAGVVRARKPRRLPVVLSHEEIERLLARLEGSPHLVASILYGSGLRLLEALHLRVKDLDLARGELTIREACEGLGVAHGRTRPYRPQTNGKAERFIQTLLREWAYNRPYRTSNQRTKQLAPWLRYYNQQRPHGALAGLPPQSRIRRSQ